MRVISHNPSDTKRFAKRVAVRLLAKPHRAHAAVVALSGDLGAGKTTFAQGFARALGVKQRIASPTFILFRRYILPLSFPHRAHPNPSAREGRRESRRTYTSFYHVDAYRLHNEKKLAALGFKEILADPKNIVLIEWPENVRKLLPKDTLMIRMEHGKKASERLIEANLNT